MRPIRHHYDEPDELKDHPVEQRHYGNIPYSNGYHDPVCHHGYQESVNDGGGYELPLQDMTCITYKESKPPTPENSTLAITETSGNSFGFHVE